ncbi:methyltransferase [Endozoicomonas sp. (ex Bugula neritina AB1)]|nr:methyltransferase [Endozoicomonas sp. (ex Bugula neritina AB1)]
MDFIAHPAIEQYCHDLTTHESDVLQALAVATAERTRYPDNLSGRLVGQTLKMLVQISQSKRVLEIGMFTGYAALSMAEGVPMDGVVYACETNPRAIDIAEEFFDQSPHGAKINVLFGHALETIESIKEPLDFVFIDADKKAYPHYFDAILPKLSEQGIIVFDDALWKGGVLNPKDERDQIMADLNQRIKDHPNLENVLLPIRHGLNIVRKCTK